MEAVDGIMATIDTMLVCDQIIDDGLERMMPPRAGRGQPPPIRGGEPERGSLKGHAP